MPFKSPRQQIYLKINHPKIHDQWQKEYGNAPGLSEYIKKIHKKKHKKKADIELRLTKIAQLLDNQGFVKISDNITKIIAQLNEITAGCSKCGNVIGQPLECNACGWNDTSLCPTCSMEKIGAETCPDCGNELKTTIEAKTLTYKEKQESPCIFPKSHPLVNDNKDHFPTPDLSHANNALARINQYSKSPIWFDGSLELLKRTIDKEVNKKFPGIKKRREKREK